MKRIPGKDMIANKSPYLTSSKKKKKKKKKQEESQDLLSVLPLDLKTEIFLKLPAKSVAKLNFVSKGLSSIIGGKYFTDLYLARPSARPRLLFTVLSYDVKYFVSCSQENPVSDHVKVNIAVMNPDQKVWWEFSPPIHGLVCGIKTHKDADVVVINPSTGQLLNLPRVRTKGKHRCIYVFFGYDPVNDEYKVLCMNTMFVNDPYGSRVSHDHQVFTLGAQQKKWRRIKCKHPHRPFCTSKGLCMNGVVYYNARIASEISLISFDLRSEEFNVVKVPEDVQLVKNIYSLVNYSGKIALTYQDFSGTLDIRVLEDANKQEWSKVSVVIPSWEELAGRYELCFKGALSTGELIFATENYINPLYIYDIKENNAQKVVVEGIGHKMPETEVFFDHVDSPMFLPNVNLSFNNYWCCLN